MSTIDAQFRELLKDPLETRAFRAFLISNHSEECLDFILAVDGNLDPRFIIRQYIAEDAICPLVVDKITQNEITSHPNPSKLIRKLRDEVANDLIFGHYMKYQNFDIRKLRKSITVDAPENYKRVPQRSTSPILSLFKKLSHS